MNIFQNVKKPSVPRTKFDMSHEKKLTGKFGYLYPCFLQEAVPGDYWQIQTESLIRMAPMPRPVMHNIDAYIHFFFVPNRIIWSSWEDFITGKQLISIPTMELISNHDYQGELPDYLGLPSPTFSHDTFEVSALPLRAYKAIYNEWYRDQNLIDEVDITADDEMNLLKRAWEKDYFTSAMTTAQQGDPVKLELDGINWYTTAMVEKSAGGVPAASTNLTTGATAVGTQRPLMVGIDSVQLQNFQSIEIDINELRTATRLQRWLERNLRAGHRYAEHLLAHYGVKSSDGRLDRPEYIGGGKSPIVISEVLNQASGTNNEYLGELAGHGLGIGESNYAKYYIEEHGYILGIMSVMPRTGYFQGVPRTFLRQDPTDFYFPEFARLGEQEVKNKELYFGADSATNEETFGYQARYAEYKYAPSTVHGDFRGTLEEWHLNRKFLNYPTLNQSFIEPDDNDVDKIFQVQDGTDYLWVQLYHKVAATRPMPFFNNPTL